MEGGNTQPKWLLVIAIIVLMIALATFYKVRQPAPPQRTFGSALEVFISRSVWKELPSDFLSALAHKLSSADKATEFTQLCEQTGVLENNIAHLTDTPDVDVDLAVAGVAITLTSYANAMGEQGQFSRAKRALELALLLKPRHSPAWCSMALVAFSMDDCAAAVYWADKVLAFKPDPRSKDPFERAAAASMTKEGEREAAEALGEAELVGNWRQVQEQMIAIKDACRK